MDKNTTESTINELFKEIDPITFSKLSRKFKSMKKAQKIQGVLTPADWYLLE